MLAIPRRRVDFHNHGLKVDANDSLITKIKFNRSFVTIRSYQRKGS